MGVKATRVDDVDASGLPAGSFEFYDTTSRKDAGMIYICPCGCGRQGVLRFRPHESPSWEWNGDRDAPTLTPSVHDQIVLSDGTKRTHWHGYLTNGVWESC